jgi:hypothetical protein
MNRIEKAFSGKKTFIPFVTAGDPNLATTERLVLEMANAGADLIELGIPFSDPVAEGDAIQKADERALASGTTTDQIFALVKRIREKSDIPLAFMTYMNPIFVYGTDKFVSYCADCGVDALIVPDLPLRKGRASPRLRKVRRFLNLHGCADVRRAHRANRLRGAGLCVLRFFAWRHRCARADHDRRIKDDFACKSSKKHPVRRRLGHLDARAGQKAGRRGGRRYRGQCDCTACGRTWGKLRRAGPGLCPRHEARH